jgi:hypothetical protein
LTVLDVAGNRYARLSFWCPTVAANVGKPLDHQSGWLKETARHTDRRTRPLMINERAEIQPDEFERIHHGLRRILADQAWPIADRLAAASAIVRRLDMATAEGGRASMAQVAAAAEREGVAALAAEARRGGHPSGGRRVLSLYLLQDRLGGRWSILARLASVLMFNTGLTKLRSCAVPGSASWRQIRRVTFRPSPASAGLVTRYFCSKLDSRRYVAGEATLVTGFNLLLAAYAMIDVLARLRAASEGRQTTDDEDVQLAVSAADLLVVEHPGLHYGRVHARLVDAALGDSDLCGDLLARLS